MGEDRGSRVTAGGGSTFSREQAMLIIEGLGSGHAYDLDDDQKPGTSHAQGPCPVKLRRRQQAGGPWKRRAIGRKSAAFAICYARLPRSDASAIPLESRCGKVRMSRFGSGDLETESWQGAEARH